MNRDMLNVINNFASVFRDCYKIGIPACPMDEIVKRLNGTIVETDSLEVGVDGLVKKTRDDSFIVELRSNISSLRKRFTIAHELGHLFFDMGYIIDEDSWQNVPVGKYYRRSENMNNSESIANEFAAALLMPRKEFRDKFVECTDADTHIVNVSELADYFIVSEDAALTRAKWLGLVSW